MSPRSIGLSDALQSYIDAHSTTPDAVQRRLIADTEALGGASVMQISPEQGTVLSMLVGMLQPALAVEVGTFTGYSSLAIAHALPPHGRLLCCDVSEEWTAMARAAWATAGVGDRIELRIAPAIDTLRGLPADTVVGFAFIDADKSGYISYYEELLSRLAPNGMIAVDNTLWSGAVVDDTDTSTDTVAIRAFNTHVAADDRTVQVITPIGDGLTLIRARVTATDDHARTGDGTDEPGDDDAGATAEPAAPPTKPRLADAVVALQIPEFRRFWLAAIASNSGSWLQGLAMPFIMYDMTESGAWVGASVFSIMLPMALVGPFAGPLADRVPRRTILIACQTILSIIAFAFAALWWSGVRNPWAYLATSVLYGIVNGFSMPAWQAFVSDLVPRRLLMNAITLNSAQFNAARAIGPSIGGVVIAAFGAGWAFGGNALSFIVVVVALVSLPRPERRIDRASESPLRAFVQGGRYARTQPGILTGYLAAVLLAIFGGTLVQVHLVLFAEEVFDVSAFRFGLLVSAYGIGAILAAPWLASVGPRLKRSAVLVGGLVAFGLAELALVATTIYWVGLAGVVAAGAAHITLASTTNTTIQLQVTEAMRGRVLSMYLMVLTIGMPVGAMVQGPMADRFGPRWVVGAMGSMMLVSAALLILTGRAKTYDHELAEP